MTSIVIMIKEAMLSYPTIYPTRWSVLEDMFFNGSGAYAWSSEGMIKIYSDSRDVTVMDYSDLDEQDARNNEMMSEEAFSPDTSFGKLILSRRLNLRIKRMQREMIAAEIDLCATTNVGDVFNHVSERILSDTNKYALIWTAHNHAHDSETLAIIEEVLSTIASTLSRRFILKYGENFANEMPSEYRIVWDAVHTQQDLMDNQTNARARHAKMMEMMSRLMGEVKASAGE